MLMKSAILRFSSESCPNQSMELTVDPFRTPVARVRGNRRTATLLTKNAPEQLRFFLRRWNRDALLAAYHLDRYVKSEEQALV